MQTNEKRKNNIHKVICLLIILIAIAFLVKYAWAKYMTSLNGNSKADIAKWSFKVNKETNKSFTIDLSTTRGENQEAEVQEGFIGPGTSGEFIIEIDATDTEVSLEYNINMAVDYNDNTVFPRNLIFYSDEEMKNAIYHTETGITLNGFIAQSDENNTISHTIYWKWDFETGQTQTDKYKNDIADSYWIGRNISIPITVVGEQVNQNPTTNQYAVTFDANGGIIEGYGNSQKVVKTVTYNEQYGKLPVPTRNGYSFGGWIGKNLWNNEDCEPVVNGGFIDNKFIFDTRGLGNTMNQCLKFQIWNSDNYIASLEQFRWNAGYKTYSFTKQEAYNKIRIAMNGDRRDSGFSMDISNLKNGVTYTVSLNVDVYEEWYMEISNIQLEEGTVATQFEQYEKIEPNTALKKSANHKLIAKWIKNGT